MDTLHDKKVNGWWKLNKILSTVKSVKEDDDSEDDGIADLDSRYDSRPSMLLRTRALFEYDAETKLEVKGCFPVLSTDFKYKFNGLYSNNTSTKAYYVFDSDKLEYKPRKLKAERLLEMLVSIAGESNRTMLQVQMPSGPLSRSRLQQLCELDSEALIALILCGLFQSQTGKRYFWYDELQLLQHYYGKRGRELIVHNLDSNELEQLHHAVTTGEQLELLCFHVTKRGLNVKLEKLPELNYEQFEAARVVVADKEDLSCNDPMIVSAVSIYHEILRIDVYGHKKSDLFNKSKMLLYKPFNNGHMYSEYSSIVKHCRDKMNCELSLLWLEQQGIIREPDSDSARHIYLSNMWKLQERLVDHLAWIASNWEAEGGESGMPRRIGSYAKHCERQLNKDQLQAVQKAIEHPISVITGRGGTGKTEAVKDVVERYGSDDPDINSVLFVGPTGRSADNASRRVQQAYTIDKCAHTLKKALTLRRKGELESTLANRDDSPDSNVTAPSADWYLYMTPEEHRSRLKDRGAAEFASFVRRWSKTEVLIVDEMSMVDVNKFEFMLRMLRYMGAPLKKLVIVGDVRQLQSISVGRLMADIMEAVPLAVTELKQNMRNPSSTIFHNANLCVSRRSCRLKYDDNFQLQQTTEGDSVTDAVRSFFDSLLSDNSMSTYDVHFIAFRRADAAAINKACRPFYTSHYQPRRDGKADRPEVFVGEKIYFKRNNYRQGVMNGQIWRVLKYVDVLKGNDFRVREDVNSNLERPSEPIATRVAVLMSEDGNTILAIDLKDLPFDFKHVSLGYATTIHKFQGTEKRVIVYWLVKDHPYENVTHFYTAITRSTQRVVLLSNAGLVGRIIQRCGPSRRSQLAHYLREALHCEPQPKRQKTTAPV